MFRNKTITYKYLFIRKFENFSAILKSRNNSSNGFYVIEYCIEFQKYIRALK